MTIAPEDGLDPKKRAEAEHAVRSAAENMDENDISEAAVTGGQKMDKLNKNRPGPLVEMWEDLKTLIAMVSDYATGEYREIPWSSITMAAAAVVYFVSPIDLIPDFIPGLGFLDDAAVIAFCVKVLREDIARYRLWKIENT